MQDGGVQTRTGSNVSGARGEDVFGKRMRFVRIV
jgi:hypothetical protein